MDRLVAAASCWAQLLTCACRVGSARAGTPAGAGSAGCARPDAAWDTNLGRLALRVMGNSKKRKSADVRIGDLAFASFSLRQEQSMVAKREKR